jgi:molybdopterin biosynthesis enzyme
MAEAAAFPTGLSVEQARDALWKYAALRMLPPERIALASALGERSPAMRAPFDIPGFTNSAMDGLPCAARSAGQWRQGVRADRRDSRRRSQSPEVGADAAACES